MTLLQLNIGVVIGMCICGGIALSRFSAGNIILSIILLLPIFNLVNNILVLSNGIYSFPDIVFISFFMAQLFAVAILVYIRFFTTIQPYKVGKEYILTVIILCIVIFSAIRFHLLDNAGQQHYLERLLSGDYPQDLMLVNLLFAVNQFYLFFVAYYEVIKFTKQAKEVYADFSSTKIMYIKNFTLFVIALNFIMFCSYFIFPAQTTEYLVIPVILILVDVYLIMNAIRSNALFTPNEYCTFQSAHQPINNYINITDPLCSEIKSSIKKGKAKLVNAEIEYLHKQILHELETKQLYTNSQLNLAHLSNILEACAYSVSATINQKFKMNFFDLINSYRVQHVIRNLKMNQDRYVKIEPLAYESGFASMSSFYRAFKKHTGKTPLEYQNKKYENRN